MALGAPSSSSRWPWEHGSGREVGENGEEAEGVRFPYSPRAEVAGYGCGGGAADLGRGRAVVRVVVVEESCAQSLFIGGERRRSAVEAGRRARRPLMVLGLVGASRSGSAIRGGGADDGTARAEAERRAEHPAARGHGTGVRCSAAHGTGEGHA